MAEIRIDHIIIDYDGHHITFKSQNNWQFSIGLEASAIPDLIEYFRSFQVDDTQRRNAFRVPLTDSSGLSVNLRYKDKSYSVKPLDISLTGILIEFDGDDIAIGAKINLTLLLGDETAIISGKIVRRDVNKYGISFSDVIVGTEVLPPASLQSIVSKLEKEWLRKRIKSSYS